MSNTQILTEPLLLGAGEGRHLHFLNHLATIKVAPGDQGSMSAVEFLAPRGFGPPLHRHRDEDELFVIFDGELAFHTGEGVMTSGAGTIAHLPRAVPHTFQVLSEKARFLNVTSSNARIPRFDRMVTELGLPAGAPTLPEPGYIDPSQVAEVCLRFGIEILGPPPAPLT